jgi:hypothetical protein
MAAAEAPGSPAAYTRWWNEMAGRERRGQVLDLSLARRRGKVRLSIAGRPMTGWLVAAPFGELLWSLSSFSSLETTDGDQK